MKAFQIVDARGVNSLESVRLQCGEPAPGDVKVKIKMSSINYRDLVTIEDPVSRNVALPFVPNSDAAGEIVELGEGVEDFKLGDRVMSCFFQE